MYITKTNKILYDTKNFDSVKNFYAILINDTIVKTNQDRIDHYDVLNINISQEIFWMYFPIINGKAYKDAYKIIYGHFYNNSDMFIYKDIYTNKIVSHSIKKTYIEKLYYNKNKLLYNKSYKYICDQLEKLEKIKREEFYSKQQTIDYKYEDEEIIINDNTDYVNHIYEDECLILINTNKTNIIQ